MDQVSGELSVAFWLLLAGSGWVMMFLYFNSVDLNDPVSFEMGVTLTLIGLFMPIPYAFSLIRRTLSVHDAPFVLHVLAWLVNVGVLVLAANRLGLL